MTTPRGTRPTPPSCPRLVWVTAAVAGSNSRGSTSNQNLDTKKTHRIPKGGDWRCGNVHVFAAAQHAGIATQGRSTHENPSTPTPGSLVTWSGSDAMVGGRHRDTDRDTTTQTPATQRNMRRNFCGSPQIWPPLDTPRCSYELS